MQIEDACYYNAMEKQQHKLFVRKFRIMQCIQESLYFTDLYFKTTLDYKTTWFGPKGQFSVLNEIKGNSCKENGKHFDWSGVKLALPACRCIRTWSDCWPSGWTSHVTLTYSAHKGGKWPAHLWSMLFGFQVPKTGATVASRQESGQQRRGGETVQRNLGSLWSIIWQWVSCGLICIGAGWLDTWMPLVTEMFGSEEWGKEAGDHGGVNIDQIGIIHAFNKVCYVLSKLNVHTCCPAFHIHNHLKKPEFKISLPIYTKGEKKSTRQKKKNPACTVQWKVY